jgi:hypothetical protein
MMVLTGHSLGNEIDVTKTLEFKEFTSGVVNLRDLKGY